MDKSRGLNKDTLYLVASHLGTNFSIFSTTPVGGLKPYGRRQFLVFSLCLLPSAFCLSLVSSNLLFACTNQSTELFFFVPEDEKKYWKSQAEQFTKENNHNIRITLNPGWGSSNTNNTDELKTIYKNDLTSNSPNYDIIYMDNTWVPEFAHNGWLMELDQTDKFSGEELESFVGSAVEEGRFSKKGETKKPLYRIPFRIDVGVLFYRKDLLQKYSPGKKLPETFDDLIHICDDFIHPRKKELLGYSPALDGQKRGNGYIWQNQQYEGLVAVFCEVLFSCGGYWINEENNDVGLCRDEAIFAVEFLRKLIERGISPDIYNNEQSNANNKQYKEKNSYEDFKNEDILFMRNWPNAWYIINEVNSEKHEITPRSDKFGIIPVVHAPAVVHAPGKYESFACRGGWGFGIPSKAKNQIKALEAIKFFTSIESQQKFTLEYGTLPSRRSLFSKQIIIEKYNYFPTLLEIVENKSQRRPLIPQYTEASSILQKCLYEALNIKNKNYKDLMRNAAAATQKLLDPKMSNNTETLKCPRKRLNGSMLGKVSPTAN